MRPAAENHGTRLVVDSPALLSMTLWILREFRRRDLSDKKSLVPNIVAKFSS